MNGSSSTWLEFIKWIEDHPAFSTILAGLILAIVSGIIYLIWNSSREKIKIKIALKIEGFKTGIIDDERLLQFVKFRIRISNHSRVPVSIRDFYLDLPRDLVNATGKVGFMNIPFPIRGVSFNNEGARMYANYLHLAKENGDHMKLPILLDSPVIYLYAELNDHVLLKNLREKSITFVVIDQNGKEHLSNRCYLTDKGIIQDMQTR